MINPRTFLILTEQKGGTVAFDVSLLLCVWEMDEHSKSSERPDAKPGETLVYLHDVDLPMLVRESAATILERVREAYQMAGMRD